jgi:hypothetical protein
MNKMERGKEPGLENNRTERQGKQGEKKEKQIGDE